MGWLHQFFGFNGRLNRAKFWTLNILLIVFSIIVTVVAIVVTFAIFGANLTEGEPSAADFVQLILDYLVAFIVLAGFSIVVWISAFAIGVKRLHDRNKRGWWILLFYIASIVLASIASRDNDLIGAIAALLAIVLMVWALIELGFRRGTAGPNRFGPDPRQRPTPVDAAPQAPKPAV